MAATLPHAQELRECAAEALRIAALVPEATAKALQEIAADLLAAAAESEAITSTVAMADPSTDT